MQYGILKNKEGVYVPQMGIDYPTDDPYRRLLKVEVEDSSQGKYQFDETYPYLDNSWNYKWNDILGFIVKWILVGFWKNRLHFGLKVEGKENIKPFKDALKNGAMCICNHVYVFDAVAVYQAFHRFRIWIPMYAKHFNGKSGWFMRYVGGLPIPETRGGIEKYNEALDKHHQDKEWMLVFPEAVRWDWYQPIRPFKTGAFSMAYKYDLPVIPTVVTYRPRKGIYRLFGKKDIPCVTLKVGEPLIFDKTKPRRDEINRVREMSHASMVKMAGIEINPWPANPDEEKAYASQSSQQ